VAWWEPFFDEDYLRIWSALVPHERSEEEAAALWETLGLSPGVRVLDAPCGYGRISRRLAARGAVVVGVDQSATLLAAAERDRADIPRDRLRYVQQDLRRPLGEGAFDVALNLFSSLGYGDEPDDLAVLRTLHTALRPGGRVFIETNHRDAAVALLSRGVKPAYRLPDGTLVVEEPTFDAVRGRVETCWYWAGPTGAGSKPGSIRLYSVTELVALLSEGGFELLSAHRGCRPEAFLAQPPDMGGRLGLLAVRSGDR
jgi:SAM-dependent methyltransferase